MPKLTMLSFLVAGSLLIAACDNGDLPVTQVAPQQKTQPAPVVKTVTETTSTAAPASPPPSPLKTAATPTPVSLDTAAFTELEWDTLIPLDWRPDKIMAEYPIDELSDDDPRAAELMDKLKALWDAAPVVPELDGKRIKLAGFMVPLEMDAEKIGEFLLVPYYGACIHVPPPPANQTVYVKTDLGAEYEGQLFDTVWVSGTLKVDAMSSELAEAGYRIQAVKIEPYE